MSIETKFAAWVLAVVLIAIGIVAVTCTPDQRAAFNEKPPSCKAQCAGNGADAWWGCGDRGQACCCGGLINHDGGR